MRPIPYARQSISQADIDAVVEVLRSDWLTQGPCIDRFEQAMAAYCGARHAVAVSNGTAALHIACLALGLGPGDLVWTSANTFVASANCARYCGADVDFVDIDPQTYNMSVAALEEKLVAAKRAARLPKIVIPVHFAGQSCDMKAIARLAEDYGFRVLEDASHAVGAEYLSQKVGCCTYSAIAVFSFHPVKLVTTGEGGMLMTNDSAIAGRLVLLRSHGITRDHGQMVGKSEGPWYYEQIALGFNYRMTDVQAALGANQLRRLDNFLARRRELVKRYDLALRDLPLSTPLESRNGRSAWHLYILQLDIEVLGASRGEVFRRMREQGILVNVHYIPVYRQPYYRELGFEPNDFPNCERYYERAMSLPLFFDLTDVEQDRVSAVLRESLRVNPLAQETGTH
jgi:UDP-4-amino-4,6-dideoxy-N-acetyl-beta-L-altrosamine transaminase